MKSIAAMVAGMSLLVLAGCASQPTPFAGPKPDDPQFAPVIPDMPSRPVVKTGSLFNDSFANNLYSDVKARRVGDLITVVLEESTRANKSAKAGTGKSTEVSLASPQVFGAPLTIAGKTLDVSASNESSFSGQGSANQSNSLSGSITVHVERVLPNGLLLVRGEKWITLNTGDEYIRLTGMLRPEDVRSDNSVDSNRVANARIEYSGTGQMADVQRQGWLTRFFNGPIWPI